MVESNRGRGGRRGQEFGKEQGLSRKEEGSDVHHIRRASRASLNEQGPATSCQSQSQHALDVASLEHKCGRDRVEASAQDEQAKEKADTQSDTEKKSHSVHHLKTGNSSLARIQHEHGRLLFGCCGSHESHDAALGVCLWLLGSEGIASSSGREARN